MKKIILGIAGEIAGGKGAMTKYIVEKFDGTSLRFSTMLRDILDRLYFEQSRDNMQKLSTSLRSVFGEDLLAKVMADDVRKNDANIIVIDGVRRIDDIKYLKEIPYFKLVYVDTNMKKRYERIVGRGENSDDNQKTFEQFQIDHEKETELQIKGLKNEADFVVDNNGSLEEFYTQIDNIIKKD
ncbi:hypothetical protein A2442_00795 [Candidatus Campbellbacteria bacterium RIFOXYC2_FULL_35_25]|uniref:Dephospho-CoA kinase n=1 Tax=Candidatus Campbellbacteria bacterium RIFOXYC2_FULL_35_25 TaxID=1797582 RepID=A0A1F5EIV6_9BACT|nr:MAG: hypothetical protein A2442_00795 [Candidatus Campbellbacteria bacterium RIFOXYC2_FULL_35_25]